MLSYSAIAAYRDCPRQYWYRYEQRLPAVQSAEAVQGVILHEVLRRAGEARQRDEKVTAPLLSSLHDEVWNATAFPDPRRAPTFKRNGAAAARGLSKERRLRLAGPSISSSRSAVDVDGWTLRGVIDRVDRTESGWRILDYKSGRPVSAQPPRPAGGALRDGRGRSPGAWSRGLELEVVYLASGETRPARAAGCSRRRGEAGRAPRWRKA